MKKLVQVICVLLCSMMIGCSLPSASKKDAKKYVIVKQLDHASIDEIAVAIENELKELENNGVEIVCCGACIDYNKIDLAVGNPTNMYFIVEDMRKANKIIQQ